MVNQTDIKLWFDRVYKEKGYRYLRAQDAYDIFATLIQPKKVNRHLDVACGLGLLLKTLENRCAEAHGIDISDEAILRAKQYCPNAILTQGNAEKLPYPDKYFDSVTCIGSLERMINRSRVISEQKRVAKQNARFCYMVRNSEHITWKYFLKPFGLENKNGHQDALNLEQWKHLFETNGLRILNVYPDHWPYYKFMKFLRPWANVNTSKIKQFPFNIKLAYEFIFLLEQE